MDKISREDARASGLNFYFTDEACINGHRSQRYVASCACRECILESQNRARSDYAAAKAADTLAPLVKDFARRTAVIRLRVPAASIDSVRSVLRSRLVGRFPELAADERVEFSPPPKTFGPAINATVEASFLIHEADSIFARNVAATACSLTSGT